MLCNAVGTVAILCAFAADAAEIIVSPGGSIQAAIDNAARGDTIRVKPGTYDGFDLTKPVVVLGESGAELTGGVSIESDDCTLEGFRIHGAGFNAPMPQRNVRILRNHTGPSDFHGWIRGRGWLVEGNEFERVIYSGSGDADYLRMFGSGHVVRRNYFHGTRIPGDLVKNGNDSHTDIIQFYANNGDVLHDCVIEQNWATDFFQGLFLSDEADRDSIRNVIVRDNVFWGTVFDPGGPSNFLGRPSWGIAFGKHHGAQGIVVERNILYNCVNSLGFRGRTEARIGGNIIAGHGGGSAYVMSGNLKDNVENTGNVLWRVTGGGGFYEDLFEDPLFVDEDNPLGPDGKPFTADDGVRPQLSGYGPAIAEWKEQSGSAAR